MPFYNDQSKSLSLIRQIGIPTVYPPTASDLDVSDVNILFEKAKQNKIHLLFLRSISSTLPDFSMQSSLLKYENQYQRTLELTKFVGQILDDVGVCYTLFKTMKPFPYLPSDVDVLLRSDEELESVIKLLKNQSCTVLDHDKYGATLFSKDHEILIDLTIQVAVSGLIYVDKDLIFDHIVTSDVSGTPITTLDSAVELLIVAAHSFFKEQMYTLSDYYTFISLIKHWKKALHLSKKFHLKNSLINVLNITQNISLNAFGSSTVLSKNFNNIDINPSSIFIDEEIELPIKYKLAPLCIEFLKKIVTDPTTFSSLPFFTKSLFSSDFYERLLNHAIREKY